MPGLAAAAILITAGCSGGNRVSTIPVVPPTRLQQTNLVADTAGVAAHTDANLVNPWGISFSATSPFWIANNHTGTSTLYDGTGTPKTSVFTIPAPGGGAGAPTGTIFNNTTGFVVPTTTKAAAFVFATEDGTIVAWNSSLGTTGKIVADRSSSDTVYKGLALVPTSTGNQLFATDFHNGKVDRFDSNFAFVSSFTDTGLPAGYAPFNVAFLGGRVYVTFAKQSPPDNDDDEPGLGKGFVDVFTVDGALIQRLVSGGNLNSPWGLALAPASFGHLGGLLLVGNFGDGTINVYDPATGTFVEQIQNASGGPLTIFGLWALSFGNGSGAGSANTLFFTAGPGGENHGILGSLNVL